MQIADIDRAVRDWLDANSVNPATGTPPDARVAVASTLVTPFGQAVTGEDAAVQTWSVVATIFFPDEDEADLHPKIERVLEHFETALAGGAAVVDGGIALTWRGAGEYPVPHLHAPAGYPSSVDVLLTVTVA
jgi:hypothetical protein